MAPTSAPTMEWESAGCASRRVFSDPASQAPATAPTATAMNQPVPTVDAVQVTAPFSRQRYNSQPTSPPVAQASRSKTIWKAGLVGTWITSGS